VIIDEETQQLNACGLLTVSRQNSEDQHNTSSIANRTRQFWEEQTGCNYEPNTLCIEYPRQCCAETRHTHQQKAFTLLDILCSPIVNRFNAEVIIKLQHKAIRNACNFETIINRLDKQSRCVLINCLKNIAPRFRENILGVVGLGLLAIEKRTTNNTLSLLSREQFLTSSPV
jgi:hypothetical protein